MKKGRKRYTKKAVMKAAIPTLILLVLVATISYGILQTEWLRPKINSITASYISLKTTESTDILKVSNLHTLSDTKGKSRKNFASQNFQITGDQKTTYQIVLYHLGNTISEENIKYYLINEKQNAYEGVLANQQETNDGGKIIYEGTMESGKTWTLRMWADKKIKEDVNNVSYEIRIKTR